MSSASSQLYSSAIDVIRHVRAAAIASGRAPDSVNLIAVSKTQSAEAVASVHACGISDFGENYVQEALPKIRSLAALPLTWHFIGRLQANKTRDVANHFQWVHTIDRDSIARRLNEHAPDTKRIDVCIQLNVDNALDKGGLALANQEAVESLVRFIQPLARLRLRGLMTILDETTPPSIGYEQMFHAFQRLKPMAGENWDTLSMGMSSDYEAAIAAGATQVRIGQAVFGPRSPKIGERQ